MEADDAAAERRLAAPTLPDESDALARVDREGDLVEHLASLGHKRILLFLSEPMAPSGEQRAAGWREQMEALPTVKRFRAAQPPRAPIEHARKWAVSHHPKY